MRRTPAARRRKRPTGIKVQKALGQLGETHGTHTQHTTRPTIDAACELVAVVVADVAGPPRAFGARKWVEECETS